MEIQDKIIQLKERTKLQDRQENSLKERKTRSVEELDTTKQN